MSGEEALLALLNRLSDRITAIAEQEAQAAPLDSLAGISSPVVERLRLIEQIDRLLDRLEWLSRNCS